MILLRVAALVVLTFTAATVVEYYVAGATFCGAGGGCQAVRHSPIGQALGQLLPVLGLLTFPLLFAGSLIRERGTLRWTARLAIAVGIGGAALIFIQGVLIERWCWLCVGVDVSAMVGGAAGVWILLSGAGEESGSGSLVSAWWPLFFLAFLPLAWVLTFPDPAVPEPIRELWDEDAEVNVVELADPECPYCRGMHPVLKGVLEDTDADVHLTRVMVPLEMHPRARPASAAYFCADEQGRGEAMLDRLFEGELDDSALVEHAAALDLDAEAFAACLESDRIEARIERDLARYERLEVGGLPQVYIGERLVLGFVAQDGEAPYRAAIEAAREGESRRVRWWPFALLAFLSAVSLVAFVRGRAT